MREQTSTFVVSEHESPSTYGSFFQRGLLQSICERSEHSEINDNDHIREKRCYGSDGANKERMGR
jgi:hypothetical protein